MCQTIRQGQVYVWLFCYNKVNVLKNDYNTQKNRTHNKWYEKQKKLYTESGGTKTPFWGPCTSIRGDDAVGFSCNLSAAVESLKSQNEQLEARKNDRAESFKTKRYGYSRSTGLYRRYTNTEDNICICGVFIGNISCGDVWRSAATWEGEIKLPRMLLYSRPKIRRISCCDTSWNDREKLLCPRQCGALNQILCGLVRSSGDTTESREIPVSIYDFRWPSNTPVSGRWNTAPCFAEIFRYKLLFCAMTSRGTRLIIVNGQ